MTTDTAQPAAKSGMPSWLKKSIVVLVGIVVLVIAYFILAAFLPRWWSFRVEDLAQRSFSKGIGWGLLFGVVCTLVPLLFFWSAVSALRRRRGRAEGKSGTFGKFTAIVSLVLAVVVAIPNLLTLSIVAGGSNAAHAGERTLDTEAPGFRGATLTGAVVALVLFVLIVFVVVRTHRRRAAKKLARTTTAEPISPE